MDSRAIQEAIQRITNGLMEDVTKGNESEPSSTSFVFLDSKTINLLLLYIVMNKELQLTRLTNRNNPTVIQKTLLDEIERMIADNKEAFEEILHDVKRK
ncbi:hypothetical protein [Sporosarcina cyprini]|uniref:hypothetical protein n=1 Tax=Sporosarcina cyprini TaxID=2910523 RepID=UPI001EDEDC32|nr:hypothetical protein [Sporosarcina cyprini]MCG3087214.1 hypothetical protein [Sporosarcina cyprini]